MLDAQALTAQVAALKAHSPEYWRDEAAQAEAAALWGGGCNEHGVFTHGEREVLARHQDAEAAVTIAQAPCGLFAYGVQFHSFQQGLGHAPSIWRAAFASREDARRAAVEELLGWLGALQEGPNRRGAEEVRQVCKQLEAQLQPRQGLLFG